MVFVVSSNPWMLGFSEKKAKDWGHSTEKYTN